MSSAIIVAPRYAIPPFDQYGRGYWYTQVLDSYLSFPEDETECNGTKVIFEIARKGNKTEVRFTHEGLVPDYQCFDKCSSAWGFYIGDSLKSLITTGKGDPNKRER